MNIARTGLRTMAARAVMAATLLTAGGCGKPSNPSNSPIIKNAGEFCKSAPKANLRFEARVESVALTNPFRAEDYVQISFKGRNFTLDLNNDGELKIWGEEAVGAYLQKHQARLNNRFELFDTSSVGLINLHTASKLSGNEWIAFSVKPCGSAEDKQITSAWVDRPWYQP